MKQNVYDNAVKTIVLANPLLSFIPKLKTTLFVWSLIFCFCKEKRWIRKPLRKRFSESFLGHGSSTRFLLYPNSFRRTHLKFNQEQPLPTRKSTSLEVLCSFIRLRRVILLRSDIRQKPSDIALRAVIKGE